MKKHLLFMVKLFKYIFIYLAIFIFIFIIGEVFSSVYEYGKFKREGTKYNLFYKVPYLEHRLRPDFKGDYENALVKINSLGFRSREISLNKPKDIFRIICIGESTTFGLGASSNVHTYPALLEGKLNSRINNPKLKIEVINAGIPSYDSSQCYILLGLEMMALDPDLIVIYTGWNEMGRSLRKGWNDDYRYSFRYRQFKEKQKSYLEFSNVKSFVSNSHFVKRLLRTKSKIRRSLGRKFNISWLQPKVRLPDYLESDEVNIDAIGLWTNNIKNMIALAE
ncbi:MAG: SGNH/GDSL hydrolase family protein, partial [Candidatus Omnitrophica bacterium]|nr:SGNH/GDSL hydrolase family protein [Candidatus Omnitrophota bacterium]